MRKKKPGLRIPEDERKRKEQAKLHAQEQLAINRGFHGDIEKTRAHKNADAHFVPTKQKDVKTRGYKPSRPIIISTPMGGQHGYRRRSKRR